MMNSLYPICFSYLRSSSGVFSFMATFDKTSKILVTCPKRLVPYLKQEVEKLNFPISNHWSTAVALEGTLNDCIKLNMNIRCGNQVLYELKSFHIKTPEHLYIELMNIPWEDYIDEKGYFSVTCNVNTPAINNTMFVNVKCKDAIVDRLREKTGLRPDSGADRTKTVVHLYWHQEQASIFIDTSGETLSKHAYRKIPGLAPMQENLAASVVMATGWNGEGAFLNPMCGSGTLAIEAAMIALNKPWALLRNNFGFMHIKGYDPSFYNHYIAELKKGIKNNFDGKIIASDISWKAIEASKRNATDAGVEQFISFETCDFEKCTVPEGKGMVLFNPEYGERLGEEEKLMPEYKRMGDFLKQKCKGYKGYIFTGNPDLARKIGLKTSRRIEFFNSKIDCRLLEYELYDGSRRVPKPE